MLKEFYATIENAAACKQLFAEIKDDTFTYDALLIAIEQTITFFRGLNLQNNQRIIIATEDDKSLLVLLLSTFFEGLCSILLPADIKIDKLKHVAELTNPAVVFTDQANIAMCEGVLNCRVLGIFRPKKQALINKILGKSANQYTYPGLTQNLPRTMPSLNAKEQDLALIVFTSGSTSSPKGVMLSYFNILSHLGTFKKVYAYNSQAIIFNNLPLYYMDGLLQGPLSALYNGGKLIRPEKFSLNNLDSLLNKIAAKKVSHVVLVPSILVLLDRYALHDDYFATPFIQAVISTAAFLNADLWARLETRFKVKICNVYGLIETVAGGVFCGPNSQNYRIGTVGKPVDMICKIINEKGESLPNGDIGELLLQGHNVSQGYIGQPAINRSVFQNGWLHTGDLARQDGEGFIEIVGRKKEVIISDGISIYPEEINEVLLRHSDVYDAASFGLSDDIYGEILVVAVESKTDLSETELMTFCQRYLEAEKMPKQIMVITNMPRGPGGKPILNLLKTMAKEKRAGHITKTVVVSEKEVILLAAEIFNVPEKTLSIYTKPQNLLAWDSLGHIRLIEASERRFQVRLSLQDIMSIASLGDLYLRINHAK